MDTKTDIKGALGLRALYIGTIAEGLLLFLVGSLTIILYNS